MKRNLTFAALALTAVSMISCESDPPPPPLVHHHYYRTTRYVDKPSSVSYTKSASVSGGGNAPEAFQAVSPPSSYSQ